MAVSGPAQQECTSAPQVKWQSPFAITVVAANVNDHPGYLITEKAFAHGGFEAWTARSAKIGHGGAEFACEQAADLLRRLHGDRPGQTS